MEKEQLGLVLAELFPTLEINTSGDSVRFKADTADIHKIAAVLRDDKRLQFDYLFNLYGVDREDRFSMIYGLESTILGHIVVIETYVAYLGQSQRVYTVLLQCHAVCFRYEAF